MSISSSSCASRSRPPAQPIRRGRRSRRGTSTGPCRGRSLFSSRMMLVVGGDRDRRRDRLRVVVGAVAAVRAVDRAGVVDLGLLSAARAEPGVLERRVEAHAGASRRGGPRRARGSRGGRRCPGRASRPAGRWWSCRVAAPRRARGRGGSTRGGCRGGPGASPPSSRTRRRSTSMMLATEASSPSTRMP